MTSNGTILFLGMPGSYFLFRKDADVWRLQPAKPANRRLRPRCLCYKTYLVPLHSVTLPFVYGMEQHGDPNLPETPMKFHPRVSQLCCNTRGRCARCSCRPTS